MLFFKALGWEKMAWTLRRLHCPVSRDDLVLEVGAGGNPYPRANVLLDGFENSVERLETDLVQDRPLVIGMVERLPFKDKSFDFVIASHVLEHTAYPGEFLQEIMRVGKAGYIETPDAFFERINPFTYHRLEVTEQGNALNITLKPSWRHATELVDLYEAKLKDRKFLRLTSTHPEPFYTRFYWKDKIDYRILNPETDASWPLPAEAYRNRTLIGWRWRFRKRILRAFRFIFSQNKRNRDIDLLPLLQCPSCRNGEFIREDKQIICKHCHEHYKANHGVLNMSPRGTGRSDR